MEAVALDDVGPDAADSEVHVGQTPGRVVGLLTVDGTSGTTAKP
jgi:hypothetical protein